MINRDKHIAIAKGLLISLIRRDGAKAILQGWTGTDGEAIVAVSLDEREVFSNCDCQKEPNGACAGIAKEGDA